MPAEQVELEVRFDGDSPSFQSHALSLREFGKALNYLFAAYDGIAKRLAKQEIKEAKKQKKDGKVIPSEMLKPPEVDLQIKSIKDGCVRLEFQCVNAHPFIDGLLLERTTSAFLRLIRNEADGIESGDKRIKRFLNSLPPSVRTHEYNANSNGKSLGFVKIEPPTLGDLLRTAARLEILRGTVYSVTVEKDHERVTIRDRSTLSLMTLEATTAMKEKAIRLRGGAILAQVLVSPHKKRLLHIQSESLLYFTPTEDECKEHVFERWDNLLRELAK